MKLKGGFKTYKYKRTYIKSSFKKGEFANLPPIFSILQRCYSNDNSSDIFIIF